MKKLENIIKSITNEYEQFISEEMKKAKEELIEDANKIYFYGSIKDYFETTRFDNDYYITKIIINKFYPEESNVNEKINFISFLWDCYVSDEYLSVSSLEGVEQIIDIATF